MKSGKKDVLYFLQEVDDQLIYHDHILANMQENEKAYYCVSVNYLDLSIYTSNYVAVHVFMCDLHRYVLSKRQLMLSMFQYHYSCSTQLLFNGRPSLKKKFVWKF